VRVITANVNGIRSAANKGFFKWLVDQNADVVCLQEVRAAEEQLTDQIFHPEGYHSYFSKVEKKGYSGVAIYSKQKPDKIIHGLGWDHADTEGRYIEADFGDLSIASLYLPSGTSGEERQAIKFHFMDQYLAVLKKQIKTNKKYIICGDWNIAHTKEDLKNWRTNQKNSGFLPEEREWFDMLINKIGYVDAYRHLHPHKTEYTWWSSRSRTAWENNIGWRIDYQLVTPDLANKLRDAYVYKEQKFSDHAPLVVDYKF